MWCVYHIEHSQPLRHRDRLGRVRLGKSDSVCLIGWFADRITAEAAVLSVSTQPGFVDEPDCFTILEIPLDVDLWPLGFEPTWRPKKP
jgi:hypothetical protein